MDKCIKVELPTGHVLLRGDGLWYAPATDESKEIVTIYASSDDVDIVKSRKYEGWIMLSFFGSSGNDEFRHFKVIAQYGDEFPVYRIG